MGNGTPPDPSAWARVSVGVDVPSCTSIGTSVVTDGLLPETARTCVETTAGAGWVSGAKTMIWTSTELVPTRPVRA